MNLDPKWAAEVTAKARTRYDWAGPLTLPIPNGAMINGVSETPPEKLIGAGVRRDVAITLYEPDTSPRQTALMIWAAMMKQPGEMPWNLQIRITTHTGRQGDFFIDERGDLMIPRRNGGNRWAGWKPFLAAAQNWVQVYGAYANGEEPCLEVMTRLQAAGIPCRTASVPDQDDDPPEGESPLDMYAVQVQPPFKEKARRIVKAYLDEQEQAGQ